MKKRKTITIILSILLAAAFIAAVVSSDLFSVKDICIIVEDASEETVDILTQLCGVKIGDNLLRVNTDSIAKKIETDGRFADVAVTKKYPGILSISARLRMHNAMLEVNGVYIVLDGDCVAIETLDTPYDEDAVIFCGVRLSQYVISQKVVSKDAHQIATVKLLMRLFSELGLEKHIDRVYLDDMNGIYMIAESGRKICVGLAGDIESKIRILAKKECIDFVYSEEEGDVDLYTDSFVVRVTQTQKSD